jgi:hypothetical protein
METFKLIVQKQKSQPFGRDLFMLNWFTSRSTKATPAPTKIKIEVSKIATVCFCLGHCRANITINLKETNYFL